MLSFREVMGLEYLLSECATVSFTRVGVDVFVICKVVFFISVMSRYFKMHLTSPSLLVDRGELEAGLRIQ